MSPIRYGIIGLKGIGRHHIQIASENPDIDLTSVVDVSEPLARQAADRYGTKWYTEYRAMLDDDSVDAVSIAVPHYLLSQIATECLEADKHLFLEKPGAIRIGEMDRVLRVARERNLKICTGFQKRTHRVYKRMNDLIHEDRIGRLQQLLWTWHAFRPNAYFDEPWRSTWHEAGGGLLISQVSHDLDLICWLAGRPQRVTCILQSRLHDVATEDEAAAVIEFERGAVGTLQLSMNEPEVANIRRLSGSRGIIVIRDLKSTSHDVSEDILLGAFDPPTEAAVHVLDDRHGQSEVTWERLSFPETPKRLQRMMRPRRAWRKLGLPRRSPPWLSGHRQLLSSLVSAIREGSEPIATGEDAAVAVELRNAMVVSAVTGRTVELPLDRDEVDRIYDGLSTGSLRIRR